MKNDEQLKFKQNNIYADCYSYLKLLPYLCLGNANVVSLYSLC